MFTAAFKSFRWICIILSAALMAHTVPGQSGALNAAQPKLKAADLLEDLTVLRKAYTHMHPGLYRYNSVAEINVAFDQLRGSLEHDQSLRDAYVAFSVFAAKIRCGHTYANFSNQPKSVSEAVFEGKNRLPFYFEWIYGEMVVTRDFTPDQVLPRGTRVLKVEAVKTETILHRLMTVARADGSNDAKRIALLGVRGDDKWETFDIFYPLFYPSSTSYLTLSVRRPGDTLVRVTHVTAITAEERLKPIEARQSVKSGNSAFFDWKYLENGAAYLRMPDWGLYNSKWDWNGWLQAHLDEMAQRSAPALIIDLRGNEGGLDVGNVILTRLIKDPLELSAMKRLVRYRKAPDDLVPYLDTWDPSFKDWGKDAVGLTERWPTAPANVQYFRLKKYDDDANGDVIKSEGSHFSGKVFVLVDANNSSATFQFAQVIQRNRLGMLVGMPTGGNQRGINGGAFFFLRLPHSKIEMDLPLIGTFSESAKPDAGLTPDIVVKTTADDIASGRDRVMEAVLSLVRQTAAVPIAQ